MKKSILGIIAVFLLEIGFITYSQLKNSADPPVAAVDNNVIAPERDQSVIDALIAVAVPGKPILPQRSAHENRRFASKAAKTIAGGRRHAQRIAGRTNKDNVLFARTGPHRPRTHVAPRPGFHTEVHREYFGKMVVEVTHRIYEFRPGNYSRGKGRQLTA